MKAGKLEHVLFCLFEAITIIMNSLLGLCHHNNHQAFVFVSNDELEHVLISLLSFLLENNVLYTTSMCSDLCSATDMILSIEIINIVSNPYLK